MTGYGRGEAVQDEYRVVAELKAVNHRYAEITIRMSRELLALEEAVKKLIASQIKRGRIEVYITYERLSGDSSKIVIDRQLAAAITETGSQLASELGVPADLSVAQLLQFDGVMQVREAELDTDRVGSAFMQAVTEGVRKLAAMRSREGEQLAGDFSQRLDRLADLTDQMMERVPAVVQEYRSRLLKRLQEWVDGLNELDESRLLTETAIFAERANIDEEIVRLRSHIGQFQAALQLTEPVGKKLDFLVQEMNREVNTIGSKANDLTLSQLVVEAKSVLEQIREQVQNVE
jgi:uncharacterized protein (TIGR00255 family)